MAPGQTSGGPDAPTPVAGGSADATRKAAPDAGPPPAPGAAEEPQDQGEDLHDRMLGEFRILRRLGRGGMAEVYLAEQTTLKRNVAVKVLHKDRVADASYLKRFKTEAWAAASLNHPNIIQVLSVGEQDGIQFIAQEYVPGMNLREFLAKKGPPEMAVAVRIMRQVASALQAAHTAGIVHRDIKPENIMLTRKGEVKVADFGLAQLTQEGERLNLTQDGVTMGTPLYMSPEQVNGSKVDLRTDIYSLGVTCYHMLSGAPPFRGETAISVAVQHLKQAPEPLEKTRGDLPPLLCRIVHKMMAKKPEQRYQTAQAIVKDLKRVTAEPEGRDEPAAAEPDLPEGETADGSERNFALRFLAGIWHVPDWPLSRQIWTMLLVALLVGVASAGIGWVARVPDPFAAPLPPAASGVERKTTIAAQYMYAMTLKDSIDAWLAVANYSTEPADRLFRNYAEQHLATLYLAKRRNDDAQAIFDRFANFGESEPQFRAFGLAGQAILLNLNGDYNHSQQTLDRLKSQTQSSAGADATGSEREPTHKHPVLFDLLDDKMKLAVTETMHRNIEKLNKQMSQEWDEIFNKHDSPEGATPSDGVK